MGWWLNKKIEKYTGDVPNYELKLYMKCSIENNFWLFDNNSDDPLNYITDEIKINSSWYLIQDEYLNVSWK